MSVKKEHANSFRRLATAEAARVLLTELETTSPKLEASTPNGLILQVITPKSQDVLRHLQLSRKKLAQLVEDGCLSNELTDLLLTGEGFTPIEGTLLDYKRDVPAGSAPLAKLLKHIVALHNTYGGFLVLGAEEVEKDRTIRPLYKNIPECDSKQIRDLARTYLNVPIEVQCAKKQINFTGSTYEIQVLHIPKRTASDPAVFKKNGPEDEKGKPTFLRDQVYFRDGDNSIPATTPYQWQLIFSTRRNPHLTEDGGSHTTVAAWSNLPDRGLICPEFIGRETFITRLYEWLADDFSCVKVLAGEGGLGKTSIAYEFASEVARLGLAGVETVVWMSAKKYQFRALENEYQALSVTHFGNSREMFAELARQLGGEKSLEFDETPDAQIPRLLKELIRGVRIFAVVDDLDSLALDEQKRCIEVCQQLSGEGSRFLFTTRKNATASSSSAIELHGLDEFEYPSLIQSWRTRLRLGEFSAKETSRLRDATLGSPLYTESLLRLIRSGLRPNDAIAKWKGNLGIEVRNAALQREVLQLTAESRKVLVTVAIFGECSFAEVKQATLYSDQTLVDCFNELQSLFLVSAPSIAQQARFGISTTTRELVLSLGAELLSGFSSYRKSSEENRYKVKGVKVDLNSVGAAINQASALLASRNPEQIKLALQTVDEVNAKLGGKNSDLLSMRGRVLTKMGPEKIPDAVKAFRQAFDAGQRKTPFFRLWYETELMAKHFEAAVDVATSAIESSSGPKSEWLLRRVCARIGSSGLQDRKGDVEHARSQLISASQDLNQCRLSNPEMEWDLQWKEYLYGVSDRLWQMDTRVQPSVPTLMLALDAQLEAVQQGDMRIDTYERCAMALKAIRNAISSRSDSLSRREVNLLEQKTRECSSALKKAPSNLRTMRTYLNILNIVEGIG